MQRTMSESSRSNYRTYTLQMKWYTRRKTRMRVSQQRAQHWVLANTNLKMKLRQLRTYPLLSRLGRASTKSNWWLRLRDSFLSRYRTTSRDLESRSISCRVRLSQSKTFSSVWLRLTWKPTLRYPSLRLNNPKKINSHGKVAGLAIIGTPGALTHRATLASLPSLHPRRCLDKILLLTSKSSAQPLTISITHSITLDHWWTKTPL